MAGRWEGQRPAIFVHLFSFPDCTNLQPRMHDFSGHGQFFPADTNLAPLGVGVQDLQMRPFASYALAWARRSIADRQIFSNCPPTVAQEKRSSTRRRPAEANRARAAARS